MEHCSEHLIADAAGLDACCTHLTACPRVGLDTEFVGENTYHPHLCLIQIATDDALYLIDPFAFGEEELRPVWTLLADPGRVVVLHAGREETRLCHRAVGKPLGNPFDLQIAAGLVGMIYPLGYGTLVGDMLGQRLHKGETLTEWRTRPLTKEQIRYAFDDVRFLLPIWAKLHARLQELNRLDWAREEFARMNAVSTPQEPGQPSPTEKWRKLRGAGSLDRRRLAVLRALHQWREDEATRVNRPSRTVVRDDLLVEIARRNMKNADELRTVRGLAHRYAGPLYSAIEQARTLGAHELPVPTEREQDPPQVAMIATVLSAALADFCVRQELAPSIVAANQDVKQLVRARFEGTALPDNVLTRGWRATHVLPHLQALLDGRRSMAIADVRSEAPFRYRDESA